MSEALLEVTVAELNQRCKSNTRRIDKLENNIDAVNRLTVAMEALSVKQDYTVTSVDKLNEKMDEKMDGMDSRIDAIESKPAKRWEKVTETVIILLVTAVIGFLLGRLGI